MPRTPLRRPGPGPCLRLPCLLAFTATSVLAISTASAEVAHGDTSALDDSGSYRLEVQACREGRTAQDRATCLQEARHAAADKRRGVLLNRGDFEANALARCEAHREKIDKDACHERVLGEGGLSGSVAGGGLLRQLEVTLPPQQQERQAQEGPGSAGAMGAGPSQPGLPDEPQGPQESQEPLGPQESPEWPQSDEVPDLETQ